ncbi:MAG: MnhB domain-containing protein [Thermoprotei archaeon]
MRDIVFMSLLVVIILALTYLTYSGGLGDLPPQDIRVIARNYLNLTYNQEISWLWAASPEAVTAIVWDYRGLDTLFETVVFYGAILAALTLFRSISKIPEFVSSAGLSLIVKRVTAIVTLAILTVAASTALHGHLTPGGGFQGGAIASVAPLLLLVVFGKQFFIERKITYSKLLSLRNISLVLLGLNSVALVILGFLIGVGGFVFQNQAKAVSVLSYPSYLLDVPLGGSLFFFNLFEFLAVASGFTLVFTILLSRDDTLRKELEGEELGY